MKEVEQLIDILSKLPGVEVTCHILDNNFDTIKSKWGGPLILLHIDEKDKDGLFFLTRCLDKRYFEHGHQWRIELSCSDSLYSNGDRPINYQVFRPLIGIESEETLKKEYNDLIDNMVYHFNHDNFMSGYRLDREKFEDSRLHWTGEAWSRKEKLNDLGI
jgi:hypothetical protein